MIKIILNLIYHRAPLRRWQLEIGVYLLKKGVKWKIGDPVQIPSGYNGQKRKTMYIANMFYDFQKNHIQHSFTNKKPLKKKDEQAGQAGSRTLSKEN